MPRRSGRQTNEPLEKLDLDREKANTTGRMAVAKSPFAINSNTDSAKEVAEAILGRVEYDTNGGCWLWSGSTVRRGYGGIRLFGRSRQVHRVSYAVHVGDPGERWVLHRCDVPACCNPDHLFLGDCATNNADRHAKGRSRGGKNGGEKHYRATLTAADVADIRASTELVKIIAAKYELTPDYIRQIQRGLRWKT